MVKIKLNQFPSEKVYVRLNKGFANQLLDLVKKTGLVLDKKSKAKLYNVGLGQKVVLKLVLDLSTNFDFSLNYVSNRIELITSSKNTDVGIKNPKFPIGFNSAEGARFLSSLMGDGEINSQLQVRYNNQDKGLVNEVLRCSLKIFGDIDYKIYYRSDKVYQLHFPRIVGLIIDDLGLKPRNKIYSNNKIPDFIFSSSDAIKATFISQFFSDEGNVREKDRRLQIKQTVVCPVDKSKAKENHDKYCANVLLGIKKLLSDLGIVSKINLSSFRVVQSVNKADWDLSIYGKENLELFRQKIGFGIDYKNRLLDKCLSSYKFPSASRNGRIDFALAKFKEIEAKEGFVTKYFFAKHSKRSLKTVTYYLIDLDKKGLIECFEKPRDKKGHPLARRYKSISPLLPSRLL